MTRVAAVGLLLFVAVSQGTMQPADVLNGDFEQGLTGWEASPDVSVQSTIDKLLEPGTWQPVDGDAFAYLVGADEKQFVTLRQTFSARAGDTLAFAVFFDAGDRFFKSPTGAAPSNDEAYAKLHQKGTATILYSKSLAEIEDAGRLFGSDGWRQLEHQIPATGVYVLEFGVRNGGDTFFSSALGVDAVKISASR